MRDRLANCQVGITVTLITEQSREPRADVKPMQLNHHLSRLKKYLVLEILKSRELPVSSTQGILVYHIPKQVLILRWTDLSNEGNAN